MSDRALMEYTALAVYEQLETYEPEIITEIPLHAYIEESIRNISSIVRDSRRLGIHEKTIKERVLVERVVIEKPRMHTECPPGTIRPALNISRVRNGCPLGYTLCDGNGYWIEVTAYSNGISYSCPCGLIVSHPQLARSRHQRMGGDISALEMMIGNQLNSGMSSLPEMDPMEQRITLYLRSNPQGVSWSDIKSNVKGDNKHKHEILKSMLEREIIIMTKIGNTTVYRIAR